MKRLHRKQMLPFFSKLSPCLIGVEACATAHYWARTLAAIGHEVKLMPPSYVKGYVKRGKSDALDAEAICEAVQRPSMRFVPVKTVEQQAILMALRTRSLLVRQRTMVANALRAHLAEFGLVANPGIANLAKLAQKALTDPDRFPAYAQIALEILIQRLLELGEEIGALDREIAAWHAGNEASQRLAAIPGIGVITASALAATVTDPEQFRSGRQFAAWLRADTTANAHRRENAPRRHLQARRQISPALAGRRRHRGDASREGQGDAPCRLGEEAAREKTVQARLRRARQQARADRMGSADEGRNLPSRPRNRLRYCAGPRNGKGSR